MFTKILDRGGLVVADYGEQMDKNFLVKGRQCFLPTFEGGYDGQKSVAHQTDLRHRYL
jgi:hypothetical protein